MVSNQSLIQIKSIQSILPVEICCNGHLLVELGRLGQVGGSFEVGHLDRGHSINKSINNNSINQLVNQLINRSIHPSLNNCQLIINNPTLKTLAPPSLAALIIFGVWISTNPLPAKDSLK